METLLGLSWLIAAFPLAGFVVLLLFGRRLGEPLAGWLATGAMFASFAMSLLVFVGLNARASADRLFVRTLFEWIPAGDFLVEFGLLIDPLSVTMTLFITGIGALIHLYAIGYMHGDPDFSKFFIYMNLFAFSMLVLVLGDNMLLTFLGWEGVGLCSYLLISFWFSDKSNATAGKKAFVTNRVGDWGYMVAIFFVFTAIGSIQYVDIFDGASGLAQTTATAITILLLVAAAGKSAQIPLFVWLPDAMAGPTPVSALIHAATMVTSGVYLLIRLNSILVEAAAWAPSLIAWVGAATALLAATIAVAQNDIKKVLAYSTISQLGYMFLAVGTGAYVAAIFHMVTHAFFKALLFLGSGSVIHGMGGDQDMRHYGGLRKFLPITSGTFIIGWLAIAGVPPFSGFWSKDEILAYAWEESRLLWLVGIATAILTAFYMSRQVFMTFFGRYRYADARPSEHLMEGTASESTSGTASDSASDSGEEKGSEGTSEQENPEIARALAVRKAFNPHEAPWLMTLPLVLLSVGALVAGVMNLPFSADLHFLGKWLEPSLFHNEAHLSSGGGVLWVLALLALGGAAIGVAMAMVAHSKKERTPYAGKNQRYAASKLEPALLARGWFIDEGIARFMGGPGAKSFAALERFDQVVVDGSVNGIGKVVRRSGGHLRKVQTGFVRWYALLVATGAVALLVWFLLRASW